MAQSIDRSIHELDRQVEAVATGLYELSTSGDSIDPEVVRRLQDHLRRLRSAETAVRDDHRKLVIESARVDAEREHYRELFEFAFDACIVTGLEGVIHEANRSAARLTGYPQEMLPGRRLAALLDGDGTSTTRALIGRARRDRVDGAALRLRRPDGQRRDVMASICVLEPSPSATIVRWELLDMTGAVSSGASGLQSAGPEAGDHGALNMVRDEFLGFMSHELKTPLAVIAGNAEVLARREAQLAPEQRAVALADIRGEAARLHRIVDNMLALARLERRQEIGREAVDIARLIRDRVEQHRAEWPERRFVVKIPADLPRADASLIYVSQALGNLLTNAEQHSPSDEEIQVSARADFATVSVSVLDRGRGVQQAEIEQLFEPFYRGRGESRESRGVGVGLPVARRLVEAQRGRLVAHPREGGGLKFTMRLPLVDEGNPPGQPGS